VLADSEPVLDGVVALEAVLDCVAVPDGEGEDRVMGVNAADASADRGL
jgi:hypothetical protein